MAENVIFGRSDGCKPNDILRIIKATPPENFAILSHQWSSLAIALNIDSGLIETLRRGLLFDTNLEAVLLKILQQWVSSASNEARLNVLISALESIGGKSYADALREECIPLTPPPQHQQPASSSATTQERNRQDTNVTSDSPDGPDNIPADVLNFINNKDALKVVIEYPKNLVDIKNGYDIPTTGKKGMALILNIVAFDSGLKQRDGSDVDVENLTTLLDKLNFDIYPINTEERKQKRKTKSEIEKHIQDFKACCEAVKPPSIIVFIGSHGFHPYKIVTSDPIGIDANGKRCYITFDLHEEILPEFYHQNCPSMKSKPKIFLIQTCQEFFRNEWDSLQESHITDTIICTAEMPGGLANRDPYKGSWFVHCFTYMMMKNVKDKSFTEIMRMVVDMMGKLDAIGREQIPSITERKLKPLYFPLHPNQL